MSFKDHALFLAEKGFNVFPIRTGGKEAIVKFKAEATTNRNNIEAWEMRFGPEANVGIFTEVMANGEALVVVDIDKKDNRDGFQSLKQLEFLEDKILPETFSVMTASGGVHKFYRHKEAVKQGTNVLGQGLDIRSRGGYVVSVGSIVANKNYSVLTDLPIAEVPAWVVEKCGLVKEKAAQESTDGVVVNQVSACERAAHWLLSSCKEATAGNRNNDGYAVACKIRDFGVDKKHVFGLMLDHWKCVPMLESNELEHVISSAYSYAENAKGVDAPEVAFQNALPVEPNSQEFYLTTLNKEFALVFGSETHTILHEKLDHEGKPVQQFISEPTFKRMFSDKTAVDGKGLKTWANTWLDWSGRRRYEGVVFSPEKPLDPKFLNTWKGYTVQAIPYEKANANAKAGFDAFVEHALNNVCAGDTKLYTWLMSYFAHMIQKPYERPLTTLVFQGRKGTGKNALIDRVGYLLGNNHYLVTGNPRYLTSNFNGHLSSALCLVLDEAFWSGDKTAEGQLKVITTEKTILIERKGKEPYQANNLVRLVVIGNEEWLVPASLDERRYAIFKVGDGRRRDNQFFEAMRINMDENGGASILLHFLKTFDYTQAQINVIPKTEGLSEQVVHSFKPLEEWWHVSLLTGKIWGSSSNEWPDKIEKNEFRSAFKAFTVHRNIKSRLPHEAESGKFLHAACPSVVNKKRRGDFTPWNHFYELPTLSVAREEWEKKLDQKIDWSQKHEEFEE